MEANMDENKEENFSLHFAVPPYGPSWCRRAELAARNGESALVREGRGEVSNTASFVVLRSEIPQPDFLSICPPLPLLALLQVPDKRRQRWREEQRGVTRLRLLLLLLLLRRDFLSVR